MAEYIETLDSMLDTAYEFVANEDLGQAWFILKRLQAEYPEVAEVWALMGDIWMIDGDLEYALEFYDRAVELDELWPHWHTARAICLVELGQIAEAEVDVERALDLDPEHSEAYWVKATIHEAKLEFDPADVAYSIAANMDPDLINKPIRLGALQFDRLVKRAIRQLPPAVLKRLDSLDVNIYKMPDPDEAGSLWRPLVPVICNVKEESSPYSVEIHIYQKNIERFCKTTKDVLWEIQEAVLGELLRHFHWDLEMQSEVEFE
jgi:tetratricopeptide (TPR) repeat protein